MFRNYSNCLQSYVLIFAIFMLLDLDKLNTSLDNQAKNKFEHVCLLLRLLVLCTCPELMKISK